MLKKESVNRKNVEIFCVDAFVPEDHILRKIERALDFSKIYDIVGELYCTDNGRPSIDPAVLFKMVIIQHLFGIVSLRKTPFKAYAFTGSYFLLLYLFISLLSAIYSLN